MTNEGSTLRGRGVGTATLSEIANKAAAAEPIRIVVTSSWVKVWIGTSKRHKKAMVNA